MRALKVLVVVMGVLIVAGTVTLVTLIVQRAGGLAGGGSAGGPSGIIALRQPLGSRIAGIAAAEGRVAIWVERPDGGRVLLFDPVRQRVVGEVVVGE